MTYLEVKRMKGWVAKRIMEKGKTTEHDGRPFFVPF
jgi:hypothetical protein